MYQPQLDQIYDVRKHDHGQPVGSLARSPQVGFFILETTGPPGSEHEGKNPLPPSSSVPCHPRCDTSPVRRKWLQGRLEEILLSTWDGINLVNNGITHRLTGAGFLNQSKV